MSASSPVFHRDTAATACEQPVLMNCSALVARPVSRALTPRQHCNACRLALLPLPLLPEMKFTCGLHHRRALLGHEEEVWLCKQNNQLRKGKACHLSNSLKWSHDGRGQCRPCPVCLHDCRGQLQDCRLIEGLDMHVQQADKQL